MLAGRRERHPDGAGARAHMSSLAAASILIENGIEPIVQFTCRDRNRIALQSDLLGAAALGVRNMLVLRGDDPKAGDQPDAKPVFDLESRQLMQTAVGIRDRGELPSGRKVSGKAKFFIGAADAPLDPKPDWKPIRSGRRSRPARSSPRPSSAWTRQSCAATCAASRKRGSAAGSIS